MIHKNTEFFFDFIRHGESTAQRDGLIGGDPELTQKGVAQALKLAGRLRAESELSGRWYDVTFVSPLKRALATAKIINSLVPLGKLIQTPALRERNCGEWDGAIFDVMYKEQNLVYMNRKGSAWFVPPGGESHKMVELRMAQWFMEEVLHNKEYIGREMRFAIIGHGTALRCLLDFILEFGGSSIHRFELANCSLTRLRFSRKGWFVECINDTGHLVC